MIRAFTFIELLVVVAIIAALSVLLVPLIAGGSKVADEESTKAYLQIVNAGIQAYKDEFDVYPLQADWEPRTPIDADASYWRAPADADRYTALNNLAYALCHPDPKISQGKAAREDARLRYSYQSSLIADKINEAKKGGTDVDFSAGTLPYALYDDYVNGEDRGKPLIYIHDPLGDYHLDGAKLVWDQRGRKNAEAYALKDGKDPHEYSAFTHAYTGFELSYELWSIGPDGEFHENLHDENQVFNEDNICAVKYK